MNDIVKKAYEFAKKKHFGQFRRDAKTPYFVHCENVANLLVSDIQKAVAYCHDLIEDGRATYDEIKNELGEDVAFNVMILTHKKSESYEEYIHRISTNFQGMVKIIKIADIVSNLSDNPTELQIKKYFNALKILSGI